MSDPSFVVVGGGIIGCATARELLLRYPDAHVTVLEKESHVAAHQTGHNSGVVHAGLYYEPGGFKARLCRRGVRLLRAFCAEKHLPYVECGKLVVALNDREEQRLHAIAGRAVANGVPGIELLGPDGIRAVEPNAIGRAALHSPTTAIVNYAAITEALAADVVARGGLVRLNTTVTALLQDDTCVKVETDSGSLRATFAIACAGAQSDRLAHASGGTASPRIVPFFGQYFLLEPAFHEILQGLVYPVPDPRYPFLGVHLTKRFDGAMTVGPNAFLSLSREGYRGLGLNATDLADTLLHPDFWKFSAANAGSAVREARTVLSKRHFLREAGRYVPSLKGARATRLTRGIRAQAMNPDGSLVDDFRIESAGRVTHVRNAPSPGATSSLAIAEHIVNTVVA